MRFTVLRAFDPFPTPGIERFVVEVDADATGEQILEAPTALPMLGSPYRGRPRHPQRVCFERIAHRLSRYRWEVTCLFRVPPPADPPWATVADIGWWLP